MVICWWLEGGAAEGSFETRERSGESLVRVQGRKTSRVVSLEHSLELEKPEHPRANERKQGIWL